MFRRRCGFKRQAVSQLHKLPLVLFACAVHQCGSLVSGIPGSVPFPSSSLLSQNLHNFDSIPHTSSSVWACPRTEGFQISFESSQRFDCSGLKRNEGSHTLPCSCLLWGFISSALTKMSCFCSHLCWYHADCVTIRSLTSPVYIWNSCRYLAHRFVVIHGTLVFPSSFLSIFRLGFQKVKKTIPLPLPSSQDSQWQS